MREVPKVGVARIDLLFRRGDGNVVRRGIRERVLAASNGPLAPRGDDGKVGREARVCQLETNLIVALTRAAVRQRVRAHAPGNFYLPTRD